MGLRGLRRTWDELGRIDPLWAILTDPSKRNNRWDIKEFFDTGQLEIECLMDYVATLPVRLERRVALDFGCGVGRLTQALCKFFGRVDGVDIAESMIRLARSFNQHGDRCRYHVNVSDNLRLFASDRFDFIYSNIVLQHIEPRYSQGYIEEFVRVIAPGGLAIFEVPGGPSPSPPTASASDALFCAVLTPTVDSLTAEVGARVEIGVRVGNASASVWSAPHGEDLKYRIRLANHWLDAHGRVLRRDDARAELPADLPPTATVEIPLVVTMPAKEGEYILELDMVQEGVAWFGDRGSPTVRVPVRVTGEVSRTASITKGAAVDDGAAHEDAVPIMEMHSLPRQVVLDAIARAGGRSVHIEEQGLTGYRYCVTK